MNRAPVLFVVLQTDASANGGVESITNVITSLESFLPIVLTNRVSDFTRRWEDTGAQVHVLEEFASRGFRHAPGRSVGTYWRYYHKLRNLVAASGARIIHANDPMAFQLALLAAKWTRTPIALNLRDTLAPDRPPPKIRYRAIFSAADHVFFLSRDMAERWSNIAGNARKSFSVTYSIVNRKKFAAAAPRRGEKPIVLVSGIACPKKNQLNFLRHVAPSLAAEGVETWLAGDFDPENSAYARACLEAAQPLGGSVRFLGYRQDVPDLLREAWIVAVPSTHEGLVRAMIEAMSCARPVVSFDISSAREILEPSGAGAVIPVGDYPGMARAILSYCRDFDRRAAAGESGSKSAQTLFDRGAVLGRYEEAYDRLMRNS